jgi:hypothetical protein
LRPNLTLQLGIIPFLDLAEKDSGDVSASSFKLDCLQIVGQHHCAATVGMCRNLPGALPSCHRSLAIRRTEIDRLREDLFLASADPMD